jgi:hypothetical protein
MYYKGHEIEQLFVEFTDFSLLAQGVPEPNPGDIGEVIIYWHDNKTCTIHNCTYQEWKNLSQAIEDLKHPEETG